MGRGDPNRMSQMGAGPRARDCPDARLPGIACAPAGASHRAPPWRITMKSLVSTALNRMRTPVAIAAALAFVCASLPSPAFAAKQAKPAAAPAKPAGPRMEKDLLGEKS